MFKGVVQSNKSKEAEGEVQTVLISNLALSK